MDIHEMHVLYTAHDGVQYNICIAYNTENALLLWGNGYKACACCMSEQTREAVLVALEKLPESIRTVTVQVPACFGGYRVGKWASENAATRESLKRYGLERLVFMSDTPSSLLPVYEKR